jgi:hydroxymethylpyrimidine/phosphomethylpyrimidine kinase
LRAVALTIAGSDPSGGAGIQADLKTFHQYGVYGEAVITLVTVQNTQEVARVEVLDPELVVEQIRAVIRDIPPQAAKLGALGNAGVVRAVAAVAEEFSFPLVIDPVMISKQGAPLLTDEAQQAFREKLFGRAFLLTPNLHEAAALTGRPVENVAEMLDAAARLSIAGCRNVLVKGGHLRDKAIDVLFTEGEFYEFEAERVDTRHTHGTGCTYSAAITAALAKGSPLVEAVAAAKQFITRAIESHPGIGGGSGPVNHFA